MMRLSRLFILLFFVTLLGACQPQSLSAQQPSSEAGSKPAITVSASGQSIQTETPDPNARKSTAYGLLDKEVQNGNVVLRVSSYFYDAKTRTIFARVKITNLGTKDISVSPVNFSIAGNKTPGSTATFFEDEKALKPQTIKANNAVQGNLAFGPISEFDKFVMIYNSPDGPIILSLE